MPVDDNLSRRVALRNAEFQAETGDAVRYFFCPFLHVDEETELCRGHIVNQKFNVCNEWEPQRKDFDGFYGRITEAEYIEAVKLRGKTPFDVWLDKDLSKRHRPRLEHKGKPIPYYFPNKRLARVASHTPLGVFGKEGERLGDVVIKVSPEAMKDLHKENVTLVLEKDYRPFVIASVLKAAHLTMFRLLGYRHVFSAAGYDLAQTLATFYQLHKSESTDHAKEALADYFLPYSCMMSSVLLVDKTTLRGTVIDNRLVACLGATEGMFALGVIIPAGRDAFCVFMPTGIGTTINTYIGFRNEPPPSIQVKFIQFCPAADGKPAHWLTSAEEPITLPLLDKLPR